ncbi:16S rRNA (cytidine(1402)-2'-O)-methyltransferase [Candidatus Bipolaricaulota bacterium]|nr:16S rRNA (cytidine(1402)-2'-O)-methyltransferase [Candidatus Bipolaricaulota bacterium]
MNGTLYLVSMPIGNLSDITHRAIDVLKSVDFILAEDTRTSQRVLTHYGISTPFFSSVYQGAERQRVPSILSLLEKGKNVALVSDAGTPLISDPGFPLVRATVDAGYQVVPVPGPCAAIAGLVASGLPLDRFCFEGALPRGRGARQSLFESLTARQGTCVFYESSHRILESLKLLSESLPTRRVVLARELTKIHEEFLRGTATELCTLLAGSDRIRGEFVLILEGAEISATTDQEVVEQLLCELKAEGLPNKSIVRIVTQVLGMPRNEAYRLVHREGDVVT